MPDDPSPAEPPATTKPTEDIAHNLLQCELSQWTCGTKPAVVHGSDSSKDLRRMSCAVLPGEMPRCVQPILILFCIDWCHTKFFVENLDTCARVDPPRPPAFKGSIPSVRPLPTALMGCCIFRSAELVNGFAHEDGKPEKLSPEDIGRCSLGRANLMQANTLATLRRLCPDALRGLHGARRPCAGVPEAPDELRDHERVLREIWKKVSKSTGVVVEGWAADPAPAGDILPAVDGGAQVTNGMFVPTITGPF
ncbi:hypothetical protein BD310DRAFT_951231 [Dichomitus squalens]|uniref:Uncharacterized protein n=1 Tax=Dichomitus squalens TaxID=114155 RepID=A0A4Q9PKM8_9APHY|nr:hypothetical protein BD310DRAFT_951231 [Dichomitus squalens]